MLTGHEEDDELSWALLGRLGAENGCGSLTENGFSVSRPAVAKQVSQVMKCASQRAPCSVARWLGCVVGKWRPVVSVSGTMNGWY